MAHIIMADPIRVSLRYVGPEVDNGEMDIDEVVTALQGFGNAYSKVATQIAPEASHQLKVTAIRESSFDLFIAAAIFTGKNVEAIETIKSAVNTAKFAFHVIAEVIGLKKHTKSEPYTTRVEGTTGNVTIINAEKIEFNVTMSAFEMFRNKSLDQDLGKIVAPLSEGKINSAQLTEEDGVADSVTIQSSERAYFRESSQVSKEERQVIGSLVSLNKESNRGTFRFGDGKAVRYSFVGDDKDRFHSIFSHKGPIKASAAIEFDENLNPLHMEIRDADTFQIPFNFSGQSDL